MTRDAALTILRREKPRLMEKYGVSEMTLFGSVARDEAGPDSDVDVVVHMPPKLFDLIGVGQDLEEAFGLKVDVVRFGEHLRPFFLKRLERDGIYV